MPDPSDPPDAADLTDRVERRLAAEHADLTDAISTCADAVAAEWDDGEGGDSTGGTGRTPARTTDRDAVVPAFRRALDASGLLAHLPRVLSDLVTAAGRPMPAPPVAAPPYVVVTAEGVVLRASLGDGRLVVSFDAFAVERGDGDGEADEASETGGVRYVRRDGVDATVEFR